MKKVAFYSLAKQRSILAKSKKNNGEKEGTYEKIV